MTVYSFSTVPIIPDFGTPRYQVYFGMPVQYLASIFQRCRLMFGNHNLSFLQGASCWSISFTSLALSSFRLKYTKVFLSIHNKYFNNWKNDDIHKFFLFGIVSFLWYTADFPFLAVILASRSVSNKKGIPVPLYSKECVRGLYFEKCCRSNVISSFKGRSKFEVM